MIDAEEKTRKQTVINATKDLAGAFMYYDRKEDDDLPVGAIEDAIKSGEITIDEIIDVFKKECFSQI